MITVKSAAQRQQASSLNRKISRRVRVPQIHVAECAQQGIPLSGWHWYIGSEGNMSVSCRSIPSCPSMQIRSCHPPGSWQSRMSSMLLEGTQNATQERAVWSETACTSVPQHGQLYVYVFTGGEVQMTGFAHYVKQTTRLTLRNMHRV